MGRLNGQSEGRRLGPADNYKANKTKLTTLIPRTCRPCVCESALLSIESHRQVKWF